MATRLYSLQVGGLAYQTVEAVGSATVTKPVEVTIDFAVVTRKNDALMALNEIINYIEQTHLWPPA